MEKAVFCWSSGKDGALALHHAQRSGDYDVVSLLTTITADYDRVSMHGVRRTLVEKQAAAAGLPLKIVSITADTDNKEYERRIERALLEFKGQGVNTVIFGDIFLEDLKKYREENLSKVGMKAAFPLWKRDTGELMSEFITLGFGAVVTCVDTRSLDGGFSGRKIDADFFAGLPEGVDPCGENGEFHSFAFSGPVFSEDIKFRIGERVLRDDRFMFCDLVEDRQENLKVQR